MDGMQSLTFWAYAATSTAALIVAGSTVYVVARIEAKPVGNASVAFLRDAALVEGRAIARARLVRPVNGRRAIAIEAFGCHCSTWHKKKQGEQHGDRPLCQTGFGFRSFEINSSKPSIGLYR